MRAGGLLAAAQPTSVSGRLVNLIKALALCGLLLLGACTEQPAKWSLYDVSGHLPDLKFSLQAAGNKTFTQAMWFTHPKLGMTFRMPIFLNRYTQKVDTGVNWVSVLTE